MNNLFIINIISNSFTREKRWNQTNVYVKIVNVLTNKVVALIANVVKSQAHLVIAAEKLRRKLNANVKTVIVKKTLNVVIANAAQEKQEAANAVNERIY